MPHPKYPSPKYGGYQPRGTFRGGASGFRNPMAAANRGGASAPTLRAPFSASFRSDAPSYSPREHPYAPRAAPAAFAPRSAAEERRPPASHEEPAKKKMTSVSTWTVQIGEVPVSYVSRTRWRDQARPEKGAPPGSVLEPFQGYTLEDRHPNEPKATYTDEELRGLCPTCGTLVVHWDTHVLGQLHHDRVEASKPNVENAAGPTQQDVVAALRILQATRPDIIAASLAATTPGLLAPGNDHPRGGGGGDTGFSGERSRRRSRSPSPDRQRRSSKWDQPCDGEHYEDALRAASRAAAATTRQIFGEPSRAPVQHYPPRGSQGYPSNSYSWK